MHCRLKSLGFVLCLFFICAACSDPVDDDQELDGGVTADADAGPDADSDDATDGGEGEEDAFSQLRRPVEVVTDEYGMKHVYAESLEDLFFMNGYLYARDRYAQMEFFRRLATGRLAELAGGESSQAIDSDVMFRTLGLKREADAFVEENYDPDNEAFQILDAYTAGVNAYLDRYRDGEESMATAHEVMMGPSVVEDWEPADVLALGKLLAVQLTYTAPMWIDAHAMRQESVDTFDESASDEDHAARDGFIADVLRSAPAADTTQIDGFPSDGTAALTMPEETDPEVADATAPRVDPEVLENALSLHDGLHDLEGFADIDIFGRHDFFKRGSNNWMLDGDMTDSGHATVANDPHLDLNMPSVFYPIHLKLEDDIDGREPIELVGASILGVPGIAVGRTNEVAWGTTVGYYDYVDVYHEELDGDSHDEEPATVEFEGDEVEVERIEETIGVGTAGTIEEEIDMQLEVVPHHGPVLPPTEDGRPVERTDEEALSIKWVGLEASNEFEFLTRLWRAEEPDQVEEALDYYTVGSSNFVFAFSNGETFYSGQSDIPVREDGALTYDPVDNPEGNAPIFVLPSDGSAEWDGYLDDEDIPHAYNPEKGYVVTANNDQVGTTLDNNPFDDQHYLGGFYDLGFRAERITERITNETGERDEGEPLTLDDQIAIQDDGYDKVAERVVPHMVDAIDTVLDEEVPDDAAPDLAELRAEVDGREGDLQELRDLLDDWDYQAPATREPEGEDVTRSAAAALFNGAMQHVIDGVYADEFDEIGFYAAGNFQLPSSTQVLTRSLVHLLEADDEAQTYDDQVGDSLIFDDLETEDVVETRLTHLVTSLLKTRDRYADSQRLASVWDRDIDSPASSDPNDWVWGEMHGLSLEALIPFGQDQFRRPTEERGLPFYERPGGQFAVSPCDHGYNNYDFTCSAGSSLRMVHEMDPDGPTTYNAIPGGYTTDPSDPYYDSEVEIWNDADPRRIETDRDALEDQADDVTVFGDE
ncbi:MAG: penicillin acylase family protein [Persicimonas sp.]